MYSSQFFRQPRPRLENPTYQSNLIQSTMLFPVSKYQLLMNDIPNSKSTIFNNNEPKQQNKQMKQSLASITNNYSINPQNTSQKLDNKRNSSIQNISKANQPPRSRRSNSNLSNYGTQSLGNLKNFNDKQVYERQQKQFDIVSGSPKNYKQTIRAFPKLRFQISTEEPIKIRQAYLSGKPELGLAYQKAYTKKLQMESQGEERTSLFKRISAVKIN